MRNTERRFTQARIRLEPQRRSGGDGIGTIVGYASTFNSLSTDLGGFKERVAPGAFRRYLASGADTKALVNHDPSLILGRTKNGTLSLAEDAVGLRMSCDLPNTSVGRDLLENVRNGLISEMSFAFTVDPDGDEWGDENDPETNSRISVRTLRSVSVLDVSCVVYPAYEATSVSSVDPVVKTFGRSHSFESMFPQGVPAEVRSRVPALRNTRPRESRRRLLDSFLA